jgi:predicted small lipoprotein YifL
MLTVLARKIVAVAALCACVACGKKGPPLAPLHLVPAAASEPVARRVADRVRLRFVLPKTNANGPGPVDLERVEIYAITIAPGAPPPPNRELLSKAYLVGQIPVRPAPVEGETPKEGDTRPEPGTAVTFDEELDAAKLTPVPSKTPAGPAVAKPIPQPAAAHPSDLTIPTQPLDVAMLPGLTPPAAAAPPAPKYPSRIYTVRGVTRSGRFGAPSPRMEVPLIPVPSPPSAVSSRGTETGVMIEWKPPTEPPMPLSYNVYRTADPMQPVNTAPVAAAAFEYVGAAFGEEHCFRLRGISVAGIVLTEGPMSEETCVTPRDTFAPAAPKRVDAVPTPGQISLIWEANTEKDLAGYIVLRGEAPDGVLQPVTPAPIRDSHYTDTTVKPGVRYIYAVVAADTATPPNLSPQSPRVEETAR